MRKVLLALTWIVIVGAAALIVVRIAEYDGRSPMEKLEDEVGGETAEPMSLAACPPLTPQISEPPARNRKQPHAVVPEGAFGIVACSYYGFGDGTPRSYAIQETLEKEDVELEPLTVAAVVDEVRASERRDELRDFAHGAMEGGCLRSSATDTHRRWAWRCCSTGAMSPAPTAALRSRSRCDCCSDSNT